MPNWPYLFVNVLYHLGLALWIGGTIVLGALTAPALFRALPRPDAGAIFGAILRRFARLRVAALFVSLAAAAVKYVAWERNSSLWTGIRWAALAFMAASVVYEIAFLERSIEARRVHLTPDMAENDPRRSAFNVLHRRAERLMKAALAAAVVALFLS
jgi:uncharacterized membrane protein